MQLREERLGVDGGAASAHKARAASSGGSDCKVSAEVASSVAFGGFTFTKSAPRHSATPAAPAMRAGAFSSATALPRG